MKRHITLTVADDGRTFAHISFPRPHHDIDGNFHERDSRIYTNIKDTSFIRLSRWMKKNGAIIDVGKKGTSLLLRNK